MKILSALLIAFLTLPSAAHHGRDFLLVQDAAVPAPFTGILYNNFELATRQGPDEWSIEPGIVYGLGRGLSAGITASFLDEGGGMDFASLSPQMQWQISDASSRFRFSLLAGYQFGQGSPEGHSHGSEEESICGPEYGPDAPACDEIETHDHSTHVHGGIHQHGVDALFARFIMETDLTKTTRLAVNLITVVPDGAGAAWGYAAGLRHAISHDFAVGLECLGDFNSSGYHEAALAAYYSPTHRITLKFGAGAGLTDESPDLTIHAGAMFRF